MSPGEAPASPIEGSRAQGGRGRLRPRGQLRDRPLIIGSLHNGQDGQPFAAGVDSGINHPGVIAGYHTPTLDNAGYNQWLTDDAPGQLRSRILTSTAASQLNLGYLIQQSPDSAQRGAWRGEGFELATDGWSILRGAQGILLTSTARPQGASTQMDAAESVSQLKAAQDLGKALSDSANAQKALKLQAHDGNQALDKLIKTLDPQQNGKYEGPVGGQPATKPTGEARSGGDPVERFAEPVLLADTPTNLLFASPAAGTLFAGQTLAAVVRNDAQISVAHTLSNVTGKTTSLYTHAGGIQTIAANGPISLQAHTDKLDVLADKSVTVTSVNDEIEILASQKIRLVAGNSEIVLDGINITFRCPGTWDVKGTAHGFMGPASNTAQLPMLPQDRVQGIVLGGTVEEVVTAEAGAEIIQFPRVLRPMGPAAAAAVTTAAEKLAAQPLDRPGQQETVYALPTTYVYWPD